MMTSSRPYLLRALFQWVVDNQLTPYVLVDASKSEVTVPTQFVEDGKIVLNISPQAVQNLSLENDYISFNARFSGKATDVLFPVASVMAIYAKENGQGMVFNEDDGGEPPPSSPSPSSTPDDDGRPRLRVVK